MKRDVALHKLWRDAVISTRGTRCECCGEDDTTTIIEAHHVAPVVRYPALAYFIENSSILCCRCHAHMHSGREELIGKVVAALSRNDPSRTDWIYAHLSDPCPDYEDPEIIAAIREYLHHNIADGFENYHRRYYREHKEYFQARSAAYREAHKDQLAEYSKAYYEKNKEKIRAANKEYYEAHKEQILDQYREYKKRNAEKKKKWAKTYSVKHCDEIRERRRKYRETHKEQIKAYRDAHREEKNARERARRKQKREQKQMNVGVSSVSQAASQGRAMLEQGGMPG